MARFLSLSWVPLAASLLSLTLSIGGIVIATREPEVLVILPDQIRVAQGENYGFAYVYLQPAFVSSGRNDRVEVIKTMVLRVAPRGGGQAAEFKWDEQAQLIYDQATKQLNYAYVADAVPLLVGPKSAHVPFSVFNGPRGWYFQPGTYRVTLVAFRVVASSPLEASFEFALSAENVDFLNRSRGKSFLAFPITHP
ncbi:MAG: hypothetical protein ACT4PY_10725 [Armatimonadota bacterium]